MYAVPRRSQSLGVPQFGGGVPNRFPTSTPPVPNSFPTEWGNAAVADYWRFADFDKIRRVSAGSDVLDPDGDDITATKLAVDRQVEHGEVASPAFDSGDHIGCSSGAHESGKPSHGSRASNVRSTEYVALTGSEMCP
jgi:hypothetical protein